MKMQFNAQHRRLIALVSPAEKIDMDNSSHPDDTSGLGLDLMRRIYEERDRILRIEGGPIEVRILIERFIARDHLQYNHDAFNRQLDELARDAAKAKR